MRKSVSVDTSRFPARFRECRYRNSKDGSDTFLLLLLHGLGDRAVNFITFGEKLALPRTAVLAVQAPDALPLDVEGYAWFEAFDEEMNEIVSHAPFPHMCAIRGCRSVDNLNTCSRCRVVRYCGPDHQRADWRDHKTLCNQQGKMITKQYEQISTVRRDLGELILILESHYGFPSRNIFVLGFSQGGTVAIDLACFLDKSLGLCYSMSGTLLLGAYPHMESALMRTPLHVTHGDKDTHMSAGAAQDKFTVVGRHAERASQIATFTVFEKHHELIKSETEARHLMELISAQMRQASEAALEADGDVIPLSGPNAATVERV